ncbi:MAG TPA: PadR family transcriptional regulator [Anaeromyxobacteraceae bacterium]|nr:PadR family transcriptional regulator [Anaeromyxobacteraceae bacterium]
MTFRHGRHAPAFVLLALAARPSYGLEILAFLERSFPGSGFDSASVYKTLQSLERQGAVEARWETPEGPRRKWYRLTPEGQSLLDEFEADVRLRMRNFSRFLELRARHLDGKES